MQTFPDIPHLFTSSADTPVEKIRPAFKYIYRPFSGPVSTSEDVEGARVAIMLLDKAIRAWALENRKETYPEVPWEMELWDETKYGYSDQTHIYGRITLWQPEWLTEGLFQQIKKTIEPSLQVAHTYFEQGHSATFVEVIGAEGLSLDHSSLIQLQTHLSRKGYIPYRKSKAIYLSPPAQLSAHSGKTIFRQVYLAPEEGPCAFFYRLLATEGEPAQLALMDQHFLPIDNTRRELLALFLAVVSHLMPSEAHEYEATGYSGPLLNEISSQTTSTWLSTRLSPEDKRAVDSISYKLGDLLFYYDFEDWLDEDYFSNSSDRELAQYNWLGAPRMRELLPVVRRLPSLIKGNQLILMLLKLAQTEMMAYSALEFVKEYSSKELVHEAREVQIEMLEAVSDIILQPFPSDTLGQYLSFHALISQPDTSWETAQSYLASMPFLPYWQSRMEFIWKAITQHQDFEAAMNAFSRKDLNAYTGTMDNQYWFNADRNLFTYLRKRAQNEDRLSDFLAFAKHIQQQYPKLPNFKAYCAGHLEDPVQKRQLLLEVYANQLPNYILYHEHTGAYILEDLKASMRSYRYLRIEGHLRAMVPLQPDLETCQKLLAMGKEYNIFGKEAELLMKSLRKQIKAWKSA